ncbi:hypothetical protein [Campylobacter sp. RM16188]|uniref:hypothetical protein n=1 Tax=Campylobacter sp. RM16188 TaxID=1705725 RepID=UPI001557986A|nr:hypothetical protein [Campylobacter sp. RM16188]
MALKKVEVTQEALKEVEKVKNDLFLLSKDDFSKVINEFIIKGANAIPLSSENLILLSNILDFAKKLNKSDEIQDILKEKLKEMNKELIEKL